MQPALAQNTMGPILNNQGIVTQGQTGNNTIINSAPTPAVKILEQIDQRRGDGTYGKNIHISVISPYPAKKLIVGVKSPDVTNIDLVPDGGGAMFNVVHGSCGDQCMGVQIGGPVVGDYWVYVNTKQQEDVSLLWNVE
jgi:hypothetical protein